MEMLYFGSIPLFRGVVLKALLFFLVLFYAQRPVDVETERR